MPIKKASYNDLVFVNCPFDGDYMPILHAIVYTIYRCGFVPLCALNEDDGSDNRLDKIIRCIQNCRYGIHDLSRIEVNEEGLPRFNMPFETGIFFGAKRFGTGDHKKKNALILIKTKYLYQKYISDLNGIDAKDHDNKPEKVIEKVRGWLSIASRRKIPGANILWREYQQFQLDLPTIVIGLALDPNNLGFNDYCLIVEEIALKEVED